MLNKPINNILEPQFKIFYSEAIKSAREDFKINISDKIESLEHLEKWKVLISEKGKINNLIAQNEHPYYVKNHMGKDWLLMQYSSRYFLLNIDESIEFKEAVYLGEFRHLIGGKIDELIDQIPEFSFNEFVSGKECKYLNLDNTIFNIEEEEYLKIIDWRSKKIVNIVSFELELLVKNYQKYCSKLEDPLDFIKKQLEILEEGLVETVSSAKELKTTFSKLFAFKDVDLDGYKDELLILNYPTFFDDKKEFKFISPVTIKEILVKLTNKPIKLFSNEYVLFYTLSAFSSWLKSIVNGKPIQELFKYSASLNLLEQSCNEAEVELRAITENINVFLSNTAKSRKDIKVYLKNELEKQIITYNNTENKFFYYLLGKGNKNELISDFEINILFNNNQEGYFKKLKEVYILIGVSKGIVDFYKYIFETKCVYSINARASNMAIQTLINKMVLNKDIYDESENIYGVFFKNFSDYLPIDFTFYNIRQKNISLFEKSTERFLGILNSADPSKKVLYIQTRLKELKHSELMLRASNEKDVSFSEDEFKYENLFKELLSIEADFIQGTAQISPHPLLSPSPSKKASKVKSKSIYHSFYYKKIETSLSNLTGLMNSLKERNLISNHTDLADFRKVFKSEKIETPVVWVGNISELTYFIKQLHNVLQYVDSVKQEIWSVTIKCFIQENGEQYNRGRLRAQKVPATSTSKNIDSALKALK